jgi:hypothetical protein
MIKRFVTEDILDSSTIVYFKAGVAEWLSRWPRDPRSIKWASQPVGFVLAGVRIPSPAPST